MRKKKSAVLYLKYLFLMLFVFEGYNVVGRILHWQNYQTLLAQAGTILRVLICISSLYLFINFTPKKQAFAPLLLLIALAETILFILILVYPYPTFIKLYRLLGPLVVFGGIGYIFKNRFKLL